MHIANLETLITELRAANQTLESEVDTIKIAGSSSGNEASSERLEALEATLKAERDRCAAADEGWSLGRSPGLLLLIFLFHRARSCQAGTIRSRSQEREARGGALEYQRRHQSWGAPAAGCPRSRTDRKSGTGLVRKARGGCCQTERGERSTARARQRQSAGHARGPQC